MALVAMSTRQHPRSSTGQASYARVGGYHRGVNALSRLKTNSANASRTAAVSRNVPRPVQTSSLRKENGGQDINAVLINRQGSGKAVGWGSAVPKPAAVPIPVAEPTPAEPTPGPKPGDIERNQRNAPSPKQYPPLPPPPDASRRNVPWALHPPSNPPTSAGPPQPRGPEEKTLDSSPHHQQVGGRGEVPSHRNPQQPPYYHRSDQYDRDEGDRFGHQENGRWSRGYRDDRYGDNQDYSSRRQPYSSQSQRWRNDANGSYHARGDRGDSRFDYEGRSDNRDYRGGYSDHGDYRDYRGGRDWDGPRRYESRNFANESDVRAPTAPQRYGGSYYRSDDRRRGDEYVDHRHGRSSYPDEEQRRPFASDGYSRDREREWRSHDHGRNRDLDGGRGGVENSCGGDRTGSQGRENVDSVSRSSNFDYPQNGNSPSQSTFHRHQSPPQSEEDVVIEAIREREAAERRTQEPKGSMVNGNERESFEQSCRTEAGADVLKANASDPCGPTGILRRTNSDDKQIDEDHRPHNETRCSRESLPPVANDVAAQRFAQPSAHSLRSGEKSSMPSIEKTPVRSSSANHVGSEPRATFSDVASSTSPKATKEAGTSDGAMTWLQKRRDIAADEPPRRSGSTEKNSVVEKEMTDLGPKKDVVGVTTESSSASVVGTTTNAQPVESTLSQRDQHVVEEASETEKQTKTIGDVGVVSAKDARETALEQQQNILRHVAAARKQKSSSRNPPRKKEDEATPGKKREDAETNVVAQTRALSDAEREAKMAAAKSMREEARKSRPPRTNGVLYRRLEDGSIVNADLSEREVARRKAREEKRKKKEERRRAREKKRSERRKARDRARAKSRKTKKATPEQPPEPQPKVFKPAPPPSVPAWNAGPPPGFGLARPSDPGAFADLMSTSSSSSPSSSSSSNSSGTPNGDVPRMSQPEQQMSWSQPPNELTTGGATWNSFGGTAIWGGSVDATAKTIASAGIPLVVPPTEDGAGDDSGAALTDASDAVPRDLLKSPSSTESREKKNVPSRKARRRRRFGSRKKVGNAPSGQTQGIPNSKPSESNGDSAPASSSAPKKSRTRASRRRRLRGREKEKQGSKQPDGTASSKQLTAKQEPKPKSRRRFRRSNQKDKQDKKKAPVASG